MKLSINSEKKLFGKTCINRVNIEYSPRIIDRNMLDMYLNFNKLRHPERNIVKSKDLSRFWVIIVMTEILRLRSEWRNLFLDFAMLHPAFAGRQVEMTQIIQDDAICEQRFLLTIDRHCCIKVQSLWDTVKYLLP